MKATSGAPQGPNSQDKPGMTGAEAAFPAHPLLLCATRSVTRPQVPAGTDYLQLCQQLGNNPDAQIQLKESLFTLAQMSRVLLMVDKGEKREKHHWISGLFEIHSAIPAFGNANPLLANPA